MSDLVKGRETSIFWADDENDTRMVWDRAFMERVDEIDPALLEIVRTTLDRARDQYSPMPKEIVSGFTVVTLKNGVQLKSRKNQSQRRYALGRGVLLNPGVQTVASQINFAVQVLGVSNRVLTTRFALRLDYAEYFKVTLDGEVFFVKKSRITTNPGFDEFLNLDYARSVLRDLDFVDVAEPVFSFSSKDISYIVTRWMDLECCVQCFDGMANVDDYGRNLDHSEYADADFKQRYRVIVNRLIKFGLGVDYFGNIFYDPNTKKFKLIDVTSNPVSFNPAIYPNYELGNYMEYTGDYDFEQQDALKISEWLKSRSKK